MAIRGRRERGRKLPQVKPNQKKKNRWVRGERKEGKEKKTKKKGGGRAVFGGEEKDKEKKGRYFPSRSPANRWSKLVKARGKVGLRDKGYAWVPKSDFFVKVPKGRGFSYTGYFLPSGHVKAILVQL